jgi:hypothetical protein
MLPDALSKLVLSVVRALQARGFEVIAWTTEWVVYRNGDDIVEKRIG